MSGGSQVVVDLHGQAGERPVAITGWIGQHPGDRGDVAHLLVHPLGHGVADRMRALADVLGLAGDGAVPEVPPDTTYAALDRDPGWVHVHHGDAAWIARPADQEWADVARARHMIVLSVGLDGAHLPDVPAIDRYLDTALRRHRLRLGLIRVT